MKQRNSKYIFTSEQDQLIVKTYREIQPEAGKAPVVRLLAQKFNMPPWQVSRRAREIGAYEPRIKEPRWSKKELMMLERHAHKHPENIWNHFKRNGFTRSVTGIIIKRKRMRLIKNLEGYTGRQVAEGFGIDSHCVKRWIKDGLLKAKKRETKRTELQGGDIYYIRDKDIRQFIIESIGLIDLRKVDKFWFIDVLGGGNSSAR